MVKGISTVSLQTFFKLADGSRTRGHRWKLVKEHSRCDVRLHFFSVRVLSRWNSLPQSVVQVNSINCFKNQLDKLRINQMDFFNGRLVRSIHWLLKKNVKIWRV